MNLTSNDGVETPVPTVVLDDKLRILRVNREFIRLFGEGRTYHDSYLTSHYYESLGDEKVSEIYRSVVTKETGYSWNGRVTAKGDDDLSTIANLMILPLFRDSADRGKPSGYVGIFDNIGPLYRDLLFTTFSSLLGAAQLKDNDTGNHIERVNQYARLLADSVVNHPAYLEVDAQFVEDIGVIAALHDVGKIGTPDDILNKAGPLEPWQWEVMKEHTINGAYLMGNYPNPMAKEVTLRHHEHWDGSGYPHGISADQIPLSARICSIADVYDALRMKRVYKDPMSHEDARDYICGAAGTHFDPVLIARFEKIDEEFRSIYDHLADDAE